MNKMGYTDIDTIYQNNLQALPLKEFKTAIQTENVLLLDTRSPGDFSQNFIASAINIGLNGDFAPWVGSLIQDWERPILLITDIGREKETITRLARVGYHHVLGYLEGGIDSWTNNHQPTENINNITATTLEKRLEKEELTIIDARRASEYNSQHITTALNYPLYDIHQSNREELSKDLHYYIHCAGGYRSMILSSILHHKGFRNITNIIGGFNSIKETTIPQTTFVCPSTLG
jgi:rhodanese-related sulfurtransferase